MDSEASHSQANGAGLLDPLPPGVGEGLGARLGHRCTDAQSGYTVQGYSEANCPILIDNDIDIHFHYSKHCVLNKPQSQSLLE